MDEKIRFTIIFLVILAIASWFLSSILPSEIETESGNVALIHITGAIAVEKSDSFFESGTSSAETVKLIEKAEKNPKIKAIIFEINSGGGSPVGSFEIADAVKQAKKPTVALVKDMAASGAYLVASASDDIVCHPTSMVGSVGVFGSYLEFTGLLEKYGVKYRRMVAGEYKDLGSPYREMSPEEEKLWQSILDKNQRYFLSQVAENRGLTEEQSKEISSAAIYLGMDAKDLNLVDYLGGKQKAIEIIEEKIGTKAEVVDYREKRSIIDVLSSIFSKQSFSLGEGIGNAIVSKTNELKVTT